MAHEVETMTYAGATPWHGLGTPLPEDGLRNWRVACEAAGLDWTVEPAALHMPDGRKVSHVANVRSTDQAVLGVVGPSYEILQNAEALEWFEPFLETGEITIEAAGALRGGSRIWALAKIDGAEREIRSGDPVRRYILLSHSHDGSLAIRAGITDVRVVCHNTLTAAHNGEASKLIRVRHSKNLRENLADVREVLDITRQGFFATVDQYRRLAVKTINAADVRRYVELVLDVRQPVEGDSPARRAAAVTTAKRVDEIVALASAGVGNTGESVWDAYNAITEWTSWHRGKTADARCDSLWYGDSAKVNAKALSLAVEFVEA